MKIGDTVMIEWPGSDIHGKRVRVVGIEFEFDIAPDGAEPVLVPAVIVEHPVSRMNCVIGPAMIAGTVEAAARRQYDSTQDDQRQGALLL